MIGYDVTSNVLPRVGPAGVEPATFQLLLAAMPYIRPRSQCYGSQSALAGRNAPNRMCFAAVQALALTAAVAHWAARCQ